MTAITSDKLVVGPWVAKKTAGIFAPESSEAIGLQRRGEVVAGVIYEGWTGRSMMVHVAVEGLMTPSYLAAIFHYPFVHVGANMLIAPVSEGNTKSINFVRKLGFRLEGRIPDAYPDGALLIYTMRRDECKYLKEKYCAHLVIGARGAGNERRSI